MDSNIGCRWVCHYNKSAHLTVYADPTTSHRKSIRLTRSFLILSQFNGCIGIHRAIKRAAELLQAKPRLGIYTRQPASQPPRGDPLRTDRFLH